MPERNLGAGFEFARKLASARTQTEAMELQSGYVREQFDALKAQSEEIQQLSTRIATEASQPLQQQVTRTVTRFSPPPESVSHSHEPCRPFWHVARFTSRFINHAITLLWQPALR